MRLLCISHNHPGYSNTLIVTEITLQMESEGNTKNTMIHSKDAARQIVAAAKMDVAQDAAAGPSKIFVSN